MGSQRTLLGLVVALSAVGAADAQSTGALRWRAGDGPIGLRASPDEFQFACRTVVSPCDTTSTVRLYESATAARSVSVQVGYAQRASLGLAHPQDFNVSLLGRAGIGPALGVYGRIGTTVNRPGNALAPTLAGEPGGLNYGVGLRWQFSRRASATLGWDAFDLRTGVGDLRDVRATSLGLQWRY